ncbi:MAG: hypothetical protein QOH73_1103 [Gaiellaceae bacterium]|jgi:hypothetical protein|nr:hypothetical protein [Gaiellaceae bacterium]
MRSPFRIKPRRVLRRRVLLVVGLALLAAASAGAVRASLWGGPIGLTKSVDKADAPPFPVRGPRNGLRPDGTRVIASFKAANGISHDAVLGSSSDSKKICLLDVNLATGDEAGGCNPTDDAFGGRRFLMSLSYDGGPAIGSVRNAHIIGLAASDVASVAIVSSDGARKDVALNASGAFVYVVPPGELKRGVQPVAVVAYDASGKQVDRQATGITG